MCDELLFTSNTPLPPTPNPPPPLFGSELHPLSRSNIAGYEMDFAITSFGFVCDNILCELPGAASRGLGGAKVIIDAMGSVPMSMQTDQEVKTNDVVWCNHAWVIARPALIAAGGSLFPSCLWACVYGEPMVTVHAKRRRAEQQPVMSPHLRLDFSLLTAFSFFSTTSGYLESSERRLNKCSSKKKLHTSGLEKPALHCKRKTIFEMLFPM